MTLLTFLFQFKNPSCRLPVTWKPYIYNLLFDDKISILKQTWRPALRLQDSVSDPDSLIPDPEPAF
jgi:hypothetical protein